MKCMAPIIITAEEKEAGVILKDRCWNCGEEQ